MASRKGSAKKKAGESRPVGRPKTPIDPAHLEALAKIGCSQTEAANALRMSQQGLSDRLQADPVLAEAWERGAAGLKVGLRRLQMRHANGQGASAVSMTIHLSRVHLGETEKRIMELHGAGGGPIVHARAEDADQFERKLRAMSHEQREAFLEQLAIFESVDPA